VRSLFENPLATPHLPFTHDPFRMSDINANATADLAALRREYAQPDLSEDTAAPDPVTQFAAWFADAEAAEGISEANAMTLATADAGGRPSARIVLLKAFDAEGFVFYTNGRSRKGRDLADNPRAALTFWWPPLERQVRIEGRAGRLSEEASDDYFRRRPRGSRLGAHASPQSRPISGRAFLEERLGELEARFEGEDVPRPAHWGGWRVAPEAVEFWQGRPSRLHDRLRYRRAEEGDDWTLERLAP
jgi:pyridoxamine 5'-phosphate oxidase